MASVLSERKPISQTVGLHLQNILQMTKCKGEEKKNHG